MAQNNRKKQGWLIDGRLAFFSSSWMPKAFSRQPKPIDGRNAPKEVGPVKEKPSIQPSGEIYVAGSGLVRVPPGRVHEIPKVIQEHHEREAEMARLLLWARR